MWHASTKPDLENPTWVTEIELVDHTAEVFCAWLDSQEGRKALSYNYGTPTVLDILDVWISKEDNIFQTCSFDHFINLIAFLVDAWVQSGMTSIGEHPLWLNEAGEKQVIAFCRVVEFPDVRMGAVHPVLSRANYEVTWNLAIHYQSRQLQNQITKLQESLDQRTKKQR